MRRRGLRTLTLALGTDPARSARALHAVEPRAIVIAGRRTDLDALGRLVFAARRIGGEDIAIFDFRGALPDSGAQHRHAAVRASRSPRSTRSSACSTAASFGPRSRPGSTASRASRARPRSRARARSRAEPPGAVRRARRMIRAMQLVPGDPLAHRALESLLRAESNVRRRLALDLEREGLSPTGFFVLVILASGGGELELRARARAACTPRRPTRPRSSTRSRRAAGCRRFRLSHDRRAAGLALTRRGQGVVDRLFPEHTERVERAFAVLDEDEKRSLAAICRKLAA